MRSQRAGTAAASIVYIATSSCRRPWAYYHVHTGNDSIPLGCSLAPHETNAPLPKGRAGRGIWSAKPCPRSSMSLLRNNTPTQPSSLQQDRTYRGTPCLLSRLQDLFSEHSHMFQSCNTDHYLPLSHVLPENTRMATPHLHEKI